MLVSKNLIASSERRLTFDPEELSEQLDHRKPINNESTERVKIRLAVAESQGLNTLERIIACNDLMPVNYLEKGMDAARAVGRIHKRDSQSGNLLDYATGFLISPRLLLTNHHVFASSDEAQLSEVEFNYQQNKDGTWMGSEFFALQPDTFFFADEELDFAVVAVAQTARQSGKPLAGCGWLTLDPQIGKVSPGEYLTIIQHPSGGDKQIALRENQLLKIDTHTLWYRTDTAPGSSGSPVFNDVWQVVALHHSGVPEKDANGNYITLDGKPSERPINESKIKWIANEGIRVSRIVASLQAAYGNHSLVRGIFETNSSNLSSPVHINSQLQESPMSLDVTALTGNQLTYGRGTQIERNEARPVTNYSDRKGYDPNFLGSNGKRVPLPELTDKMKRDCAINRMAGRGMDEYLLPYHHFSIVMNKVRKMAFYTAVNLDGTKIDRSIGRDDNWIADPRIGENEQTNNSLYKNNDLDRGHLVRRLDPVWGSVAEAANSDTFHYTNCSPQHKDFNQNEVTWLGLENYILDNARAEKFRVSVFTGSVFRNDDREHRRVKLPRQFWKVLVMVKEGNLSATGYLLSQEELIQNFPKEAFSDDRRVRTYQVPIQEIEDLTGLSFGLSEFDPMESSESTSRIIPISSYEAIRL
ncbi:MAG TPA: endonuclease [Cyanobacteria bacterium UBA8553]|nr:endonuclease [Cyanobacteria bacterium UBA8553]HAJ60653.1 endonuclease [Cyanobacteria bacterium UBA8543]